MPFRCWVDRERVVKRQCPNFAHPEKHRQVFEQPCKRMGPSCCPGCCMRECMLMGLTSLPASFLAKNNMLCWSAVGEERERRRNRGGEKKRKKEGPVERRHTPFCRPAHRVNSTLLRLHQRRTPQVTIFFYAGGACFT
eukprot:1140753-Pelagomonas_calceolata.AAC.2